MHLGIRCSFRKHVLNFGRDLVGDDWRRCFRKVGAIEKDELSIPDHWATTPLTEPIEAIHFAKWKPGVIQGLNETGADI